MSFAQKMTLKVIQTFAEDLTEVLATSSLNAFHASASSRSAYRLDARILSVRSVCTSLITGYQLVTQLIQVMHRRCTYSNSTTWLLTNGLTVVDIPLAVEI